MHRVAVVVFCLLAFTLCANAQATNTDVYHVHFEKAALGQAKALENSLKMQDPKAPMPGHYVLLRHQDGDDWDYLVIEHLGKKYTIDPANFAPQQPNVRAISSWHADTITSGPSWEVFAKELGLGDAKSAGPVIVATWRGAPGKRADLEKSLSAPNTNAKIQVGHTMLTHMEGGPWSFLTIDRYNSWQDYAADEAANENSEAWYEVRNSGAWHHDTITTKVATAK